MKALQDEWEGKVERDPFLMDKEEKIEILLGVEAAIHNQSNLFKTTGDLYFSQEEKIYADTEGSYIKQKMPVSGGRMETILVNETDMQKRIYPFSFGNYVQDCFE